MPPIPHQEKNQTNSSFNYLTVNISTDNFPQQVSANQLYLISVNANDASGH